MRLRLILALLSVAAPAMAASSPEGVWLTEDRTGVIQIEPCCGKLCGRIVGQSEPRDAAGQRPVDRNGVPSCGLVILRGAPAGEAGHYEGLVTDPDDGSVWHCSFWVAADGTLRLRGYVVLPLFGQTQTWPNFRGHVAADCTITP